MKVKAIDKEWEINEATYKQRREIYRLNVKAFWDGKVDPDRYLSLIHI